MVDGLDEMEVEDLGEGARIDVATGHYGQIQTPFLRQMAGALAVTKEDHHVACYHSSRQTVLGEHVNSFAVLRTTAPGWARGGANEQVLDTHFHDSKPKFERDTGTPAGEGALVPILHGKTMLARSADGERGLCFVGSQNFSVRVRHCKGGACVCVHCFCCAHRAHTVHVTVLVKTVCACFFLCDL